MRRGRASGRARTRKPRGGAARAAITVLLLCCCGNPGSPGAGSTEPRGAKGPASPEPGADPGSGASAAHPATPPPPPPVPVPGITFRDGGDRAGSCRGAAIHCNGDYLALARRLAPEVDLPACSAGIPARVRDLVAAPPAPATSPADPDGLRAAVLAALGPADVLSNVDDAPLSVTRAGQGRVDGLLEERLLLADPLVGVVQVRLLWPEGPEPVPAVIGLPGHPDSDDADLEFLDRYHGRALARAGFLVAVPAWRAYDAWHAESEAASALLCAGSSLLAVRQREILLLSRFLRWLRAAGRVGRIGLLAHSGGSVAGNVLVRHHFGFDALVSDHAGPYAWGMPCDDEPGSAFCVEEETDFEMLPLRALVLDDAGVPQRVPVLRQEYGYPRGPSEAITFLRERLVWTAAPASAPQ